MNFFADENVIPRAIDLLKAYDNRNNTFTHLLGHFPKGTSDVDWLTAVGAWHPRPIIIGGDGRILRNQAERAALRSSGCTFVYLASGWTNLPWDVYGLKLITHWPKVRDRARARIRSSWNSRPMGICSGSRCRGKDGSPSCPSTRSAVSSAAR